MILSTRVDCLLGGGCRTACLKAHQVRIDMQGQDCVIRGLSCLVEWPLGPVPLIPAALKAIQHAIPFLIVD